VAAGYSREYLKDQLDASERGLSAMPELQADYAASEVLADISRAPAGIES
jgi:pyrroline-5-carboxylate reductase